MKVYELISELVKAEAGAEVIIYNEDGDENLRITSVLGPDKGEFSFNAEVQED